MTLCASFLFALAPLGAEAAAPIENLKIESWQGLTPGADGAEWKLPGEASFRYPDGRRGSYKHGFRTLNDGTEDWRAFYGIRFEVRTGEPVSLTTTVLGPGSDEAGVKAATALGGGDDWRTVTLPWTAFQVPTARRAWLLAVKELRLGARFEREHPGIVAIRNVKLVRGPGASLEWAGRGQSVAPGAAAEYVVTVGNCTATPQAVSLSFVHRGWEVMEASVAPATLPLAPNETKNVTVQVRLPERIPAGGHETQTLQAIANGDAPSAATLDFITASALPHPNILHTAGRWQEVREKVKKYPWAREAQDELVAQARKWTVPQVAHPPGNDPDDTMGPYLFQTGNEKDLMACGVAWQLTREPALAEKAAEFLRRLSNPKDGYPVTLRGCNQGLVQEGHFFQHIAMAYDMIADAGVLSDADRAQLDATLRIFMETIERANLNGAINNWNLSEICGALYCSLVLEDLVAAEHFFSGPGGVQDQLAKGTMDDGWWYECSISYNVWCASEFTQAALALQPWGFNFKDAWLPASYARDVALTTQLSGGKNMDEESRKRPFGMNAELWGPMTRPERKITDLWNSLLPFLDYRGVMFGVNDSTENKVGGGQPFEIAYYAYRDPAYASVIKRGDGKRDLLYGLPELPNDTPEPFHESAFADNVGLTMLRSQTPGRPIREQIQAVLHYGTHGWAHGHFDRTNLLSLMRYGRSFYNPEMIWYSYEPFIYKFYVQTSVASNMVAVDEKMQEATPGARLLFHTGQAMQAAAVETSARWSNPPYGGMVYDYVPVKTFAEKTWREGRFVPTPEKLPPYGKLTDFSEPILQRRLMVVTDDYVVLADFMKGTQPHTFESLFQMKGFAGLEAPEKKLLRHDAQWNPDPVGSAQFVTDCDWYSVRAPAMSRFAMRFGAGADNEGTRALYSEEGPLNLDVHSLWPPSQEIMIGAAPEDHGVQKRLFYTVRGNGKTLAEGKFGAWILGKGEIDVPLENVEQLGLETRTERAKKPTIFWANARVVTNNGDEIPLAQLPLKLENVAQPKAPGEDYFGGPIKIAGEHYGQATPGEPQDGKKPALVRVDLRGVHGVRFKAVIGGDYPLGEEMQRRKTYAIRSPERSAARFLTLIEPYENKAVITSAVAMSADKFRVELSDGRAQEITIENFEGSGKDIAVDLIETKNGAPVRTETTKAPRP